MSWATALYREMETGAWAEIVPEDCPCHGSGWATSDLDTSHRCPIHGRGVPHPEDEEADFDYAAHRLHVHRVAWVRLRERAGMDPRTFRKAVEARIRATVRATTFVPTMYEWVRFASEVAEEAWHEAQDARARRMGYSCRLEAAWAAEAQVEAEARSIGMDPDDYAPRGSPERADADSWH